MDFTTTDLYNLNILLKNKGIYKITNIITNNIYIGSTTQSFRNRFSHHISDLKLNKHFSKYLQNEYNKYGDTSILFTIIEVVNDLNIILEKEEHYINLYKPKYNTILTPTNGKPNLNKKLSEDWKINLHKNRKYKHNQTTYNKLLQNNKKGKIIIRVCDKDNILYEGDYTGFCEKFNCTKQVAIARVHKGGWNNYTIFKIKTQSKRVKLYESETSILIFNSSLKCDKYLNLWRGATSFYLLRDGKINNMKVEYIN